MSNWHCAASTIEAKKGEAERGGTPFSRRFVNPVESQKYEFEKREINTEKQRDRKSPNEAEAAAGSREKPVAFFPPLFFAAHRNSLTAEYEGARTSRGPVPLFLDYLHARLRTAASVSLF